jgi:hypothetical protein
MKSGTGIEHAYCIFCDTHNLKRIDATPEEESANLQLLIMAANLRLHEIDVKAQLANRGPIRRTKK